MVKYIENKEEFEEIVKNKIVVVDFFANWCGPCKMLGPIFEEVSNELTDVTFIKIDIDKVEELPKMFGIMSIPTLLVFEEGKLTKKVSGFMDKKSLIDFINE